jgi:hypothetical protein
VEGPVIKAKKVQEILEILRSREFSDWYLRFETAFRDRAELWKQDPERVLHAVLRAGEYEDRAHEAEDTYSRLDTSFEMLAAYEQQRVATSEAWEELGRAEYQLAEYRQRASELRAEAAAAKKDAQDPNAAARHARVEAELKVLDRLIEECAEQVAGKDRLFNEETEKREALWRSVEEAWLIAFRANMARIEYGYLGRRMRAMVEIWSRDSSFGREGAAEAAGRAEVIEAELARAEATLEDLLSKAAERFHCVAISEFLYWPQDDDVRGALCVPLVGDMTLLNMQVVKLQVYRVERAKGLSFIEPLAQESADDLEDASRLDRFFADRPRGRDVA